MNSPYHNDNIFAKILKKELPCIKVYEDDLTLAFMDIMPQKPGHVLVIPKQLAETIYDLDDQHCLACMKTIKIVGKAIERAMKAEGSTVFQLNGASAGQTVAHAHFHVLPGSLSQSQTHAAKPADQQELVSIAQRITDALNQ